MRLSEPRKDLVCHGVAALLLTVLVLQCVLSMRLKSPTVDEFVHLPVGYSFLRGGDFLTDPINPPLMRMWAALPLLVDPPKWNATTDEMREAFWLVADRFMRDNAPRYQKFFLSARTMIVALSVLLGLYVYGWAKELYGRRGGVVALFLYCFCPNIVAHSSLVTADLGAACFIVLTAYHSWKLSRTWLLRHAILGGFFLGLALLSKLTAILLVPVLMILFVFEGIHRPWPVAGKERVRRSLQLFALGLIALEVLHLGYRGQGMAQPVGSLQMKSALMSHIQSWIPSQCPILLPAPYILGIDHALHHGADRPPNSFFLMGELSSQGWWHYFLVAWLLKVPLPVSLAVAVALAAKIMKSTRESIRDEGFLVLPAISFFVSISALTSLNIGFRHVLMVLPFTFIWVSQLAKLVPPGSVLSGCFLLGCLWHGSAAVRVYPDHLAYFNELAGGPEGGYRYLVDSNLDWGQDLIQLKDYLKRRGNPEIRFGYFGRVDPLIYGIQYKALGGVPTAGLIVLSGTFLQGVPYVYPLPRGGLGFAPDNYFTWVRAYGPVTRIGHTLWVYEIP